jgi:hypothetical protein
MAGSERRYEPLLMAETVKQARLMESPNPHRRVLLALWADGAITSCVVEGSGEPEALCCYTSEPGQEGAFWPFVAHLASLGFRERPLEVE